MVERAIRWSSIGVLALAAFPAWAQQAGPAPAKPADSAPPAAESAKPPAEATPPATDAKSEPAAAERKQPEEKAKPKEKQPDEKQKPEPKAAKSKPAARELTYSQRYKPEPGLFELGYFAGVLIPSADHGLELPCATHREYAVAWPLGSRFAYLPLAFLGIEAEVAMMPTRVKDGPSAMLAAYRGHLVVQRPSMSVAPFVVVGGGSLQAYSRVLGHEGDFAFHFGAGLKVPFGALVSARLDLRDNMSPKTGANGG